jgi:transcription antitermination factor NusG
MACLDNRGLQKVSETPYYTRRDDSRTLETRYSRQRLHQKLRKVARAKHEVRLERPKMIEEYELVEENLQQALRGDRVRVVAGPFHSPWPALANFAWVSIQSVSWQL